MEITYLASGILRYWLALLPDGVRAHRRSVCWPDLRSPHTHLGSLTASPVRCFTARLAGQHLGVTAGYFSQMKTCLHPETELRYRIVSNGARQIVFQCKCCGKATSNALKQTDYSADQLAKLPAWDEKIAERFWTGQRDNASTQRATEADERRAKYKEYLRSPQWLYKREQVLDRDNHLCQGCRNEAASQVHHLTYAHIFDELLFELTSVCERCHGKCHEKQP